jgi:streptomycin 6-kinase
MGIPEQLIEKWSVAAEGRAWLDRLPASIRELEDRWSLRLGAAFTGPDVTASWVAPVERAGGTTAVLKIGIPHMEAEHEIAGLRFWNGDPTVRLLEADEQLNAILLERCLPGATLRSLPEVGPGRRRRQPPAATLAAATGDASVPRSVRDGRLLGR